MLRGLVAAFTALLLAMGVYARIQECSLPPEPEFDLLIRAGRLVDGTELRGPWIAVAAGFAIGPILTAFASYAWSSYVRSRRTTSPESPIEEGTTQM